MLSRRLAVMSTHTSPLARAGTTKAGGMNVYVADLSRHLAQMGWEVDIYTRRDRIDAPDVEDIAPGARVFHVDAGPPVELSPIEIAAHVSEFTTGVERVAALNEPYDLIHSHYWVAGLTGIELSRQWQVPHAVMFHTLGAVKEVFQQPEPPFRIAGERRVIACADAIIGATSHERAFLIGQYQADASRVQVVPCGIDLENFHPIGVEESRCRVAAALPELGVLDGPGVLFVGRLEQAKGQICWSRRWLRYRLTRAHRSGSWAATSETKVNALGCRRWRLSLGSSTVSSLSMPSIAVSFPTCIAQPQSVPFLPPMNPLVSSLLRRWPQGPPS